MLLILGVLFCFLSLSHWLSLLLYFEELRGEGHVIQLPASDCKTSCGILRFQFLKHSSVGTKKQTMKGFQMCVLFLSVALSFSMNWCVLLLFLQMRLNQKRAGQQAFNFSTFNFSCLWFHLFLASLGSLSIKNAMCFYLYLDTV